MLQPTYIVDTGTEIIKIRKKCNNTAHRSRNILSKCFLFAVFNSVAVSNLIRGDLKWEPSPCEVMLGYGYNIFSTHHH
jgi:hypothetical protein